MKKTRGIFISVLFSAACFWLLPSCSNLESEFGDSEGAGFEENLEFEIDSPARTLLSSGPRIGHSPRRTSGFSHH